MSQDIDSDAQAIVDAVYYAALGIPCMFQVWYHSPDSFGRVECVPLFRRRLPAPRFDYVENRECPECESPVPVEYDHWTDMLFWTGMCSTCKTILAMDNDTDGDSFSLWLRSV